MRQALVAFRDTGGVASAEMDDVSDDDVVGERDGEDLARRVAGLEAENAGLRELVAEREEELERLRRRVRELAEGPQLSGDDAGDGSGDVDDNVRGRDWLPPRRDPGMPDVGVVTLEEQLDEEHAFGPAAALVAQWRQLRVDGDQVVSRVDRAQAAVRRWELEAELLGEYHLTLPPDSYPLDDARRADQVRWRRDALVDARRELGGARRARLLRRVLTLGLWRH